MDKIIFFCLLFTYGSSQLSSQNSIIDYLQNSVGSSEGRVHIYADSTINVLIGVRVGVVEEDQKTPMGTSFRIQVFMSNNARVARSEALSRQVAIKNIFPSVSAYVIYKSPYWKLLVGDFVSRKEANSFKNELQKEFPDFVKEMYIVVSK